MYHCFSFNGDPSFKSLFLQLFYLFSESKCDCSYEVLFLKYAKNRKILLSTSRFFDSSVGTEGHKTSKEI